MVGFIFGQGTPMTYEQLQKQREIADALIMSNMETPRNVGEGLNAIGKALAFRSLKKKADKRDTELKGEFDAQFSSAFGGYGGAQPGSPAFTPSGPPLPPPDPNSPHALGDAAMAVLGKPAVKTAADPASIKAGLVARGLPEHIADGFVMNMKDESGLNPGINEIAPLVPGSRGGFGLYQLTGPRRRAYEAFAAERGVPVDDVDAQLDFLMSELQGPEAAAWSKISGAQNAGEAGAAIVNHFLRPAEEHRTARAAEYLGQGGDAPAAPGMDIGTLANLAGNPYATPGQRAVLEALIGQQTAAMDPMNRIEMEKAQLELEALRNPKAKETDYDVRAAEAVQYGMEPGTPEYQSFVLNGRLPDKGGGQVTEYGTTLQFFTDPKDGKLKAGVIGKDGTFKAVDPPGGGEWAQGVDKVDAGDKWLFYDKRTGQMVGEEPKNLRTAESEKALGKAEGEAAGEAVTGLGNAMAKGEQALGLIDQIANDPALPSILGIVQGNIAPGTPIVGGGQAGADLGAKIEQLQGQVFLEAFESLKGAGQITEIEGQKAERAKARLQRSQSPEAYKEALAELREVIEGGMKRAKDKAAAAGSAAPEANDLGLSEDDLKYLESP